MSKRLAGLSIVMGAVIGTWSPAMAQTLTPDAVATATFETWMAKDSPDTALELDQQSGDVEVKEPGEPAAAAEVPIPGNSGATVETPQASTDVPDDAAAQAKTDSAVKEEVEEAASDADEKPNPFLIRVQVLLDRAAASPGEIDGLLGENTAKAIEAFETMHDLAPSGELTAELWAALSRDTAAPVQTYTITAEDIDGRYVPDLPEDYAELAELDWIGYRNVTEMLAERFHMDEDLLKTLNPDADFEAAGAEITVVAVGAQLDAKVTRIEVDKSKGELRAYADGDKPVFVAPASIGSEDSPSPSGNVDVLAVVHDPTYSYDPDINFQQGKNTEKLTIPAGPNGPVGNVWIDLSKPTYGIHGTPLPNLVDKSQSHGCVRLTNWDAAMLANLVEPKKTTVAFVEE